MFGNFLYSQSDFTQHYLIRVEPDKVAQVQAKLSDTILSVQAERDIIRVQKYG